MYHCKNTSELLEEGRGKGGGGEEGCLFIVFFDPSTKLFRASEVPI